MLPKRKRGRPSKEDQEYRRKLEAEIKKLQESKIKVEAKEIVQNDRVLKLQFELSERQRLAQDATEQFVLYGGAKGGGKSWWLNIWVFTEALRYRGNKLFFCRRRSVDFTNTTLETWKKAIPAKYYRVNEQKKKIYIQMTGSVIDYGGLDDPLVVQSLNSAEYGAIGCDQAEEIDKDSFSMMRGTLRHRLPDGSEPSYKVRLTANPAQCWLKNDFILSPKNGFRYIPALPTDNPYLPKGYVDNLAEAFSHRPALLQAYLHGSWDDLAGHDICIQQPWITKAIGKQVSGNAVKRVVVNDPARFGDDENVIYVMEWNGRHYYKTNEQILEHKSLMDTAGRLASLRKRHGANLIAVDSIGMGAGIVDALNELKEPVLSINSSEKPTVETLHKKYFNLRSQLWLTAGEKFAKGEVALDDDVTLHGQLGSVKFEYQSNGRMKVEAKDEIKKRLGQSPDRADCFIMGLYALDQATRLDEKEVFDAENDRVGYGTRMDQDMGYVSAGEDYSGYSL